MHRKTMIGKKWSGCWQGRVSSVSGQIDSLFKCYGKGERLAVASRPLCEVALQVRKSMRLILQLWCLVQVISLISAAPRQEGNLRATEGNGLINFRCEVKPLMGPVVGNFGLFFLQVDTECSSGPSHTTHSNSLAQEPWVASWRIGWTGTTSCYTRSRCFSRRALRSCGKSS